MDDDSVGVQFPVTLATQVAAHSSLHSSLLEPRGLHLHICSAFLWPSLGSHCLVNTKDTAAFLRADLSCVYSDGFRKPLSR